MQVATATADGTCGFYSMPVLRRLSNIFRKRHDKVTITPVFDNEIINISEPQDLQHNFHVGFDNDKGEFVGLPPAWNHWLQCSNITYVCYIVFASFIFVYQ